MGNMSPSPPDAALRPPEDDQSLASRPRRKPVQERSARTVESIEMAATRLLERGVAVESMTTPMIAKEAGVSIGGLYRFFPDKQAIVDAIAMRRLRDFEHTLVRKLAERPPFKSGSALVSFINDTFIAYLEDHPDFHTLVYGGSYISREIRERHFNANSQVAVLARSYVADVIGIPDSPELALRWRMVGEFTAQLLGFAMKQTDPAERARILAEINRLLVNYLFDEEVRQG